MTHFRHLGRAAFLKRLGVWPLRQYLHRISQRHLHEHRKQLVVYSYDHIAHTINLDGAYEDDELTAFFDWAKSLGLDFSRGTALDVGANIGNHSLYFSDHFRSVVSFEAHPRTFRLLELNADLVGNVFPVEIGLSNTAGHAKLAVNRGNLGGSHLTDASGPDNYDIKIDKLDSLGPFKDVMLLKIDVEGHERQVLEGAAQLIAKHAPIILFEQQAADFGPNGSLVVSWLQKAGYTQFALVKKRPSVHSKNIAKAFFGLMAALVKGQTIAIEVTDRLAPDFYPFVIAIPQWVIAQHLDRRK